jgi:hypothetical protein
MPCKFPNEFNDLAIFLDWVLSAIADIYLSDMQKAKQDQGFWVSANPDKLRQHRGGISD